MHSFNAKRYDSQLSTSPKMPILLLLDKTKNSIRRKLRERVVLEKLYYRRLQQEVLPRSRVETNLSPSLIRYGIMLSLWSDLTSVENGQRS